MTRKRRKRRRPAGHRPAGGRARTQQQRRAVPEEREEDIYVALPMALLVGTTGGSHYAAMTLQRPLSAQTGQELSDMLAQGTGELVSIGDRLVPIAQYFAADIPAMHTRIGLEAFVADLDPCLVELESELADMGMTGDGAVAIQPLWVLSVLIITGRNSLESEIPLYYELPEPDRARIERLLARETRVKNSSFSLSPLLYHESALVEEWQALIAALSKEAREAGTQFTVGENERAVLSEAEMLSQFRRFFSLRETPVSEALDLMPVGTVNSTFYPYEDYLAIHGHEDDEEGHFVYGEYLGTRALQLGQLRAAARERERDVEFVDVTVKAGEFFEWLEREGLENTPQNRSLYVEQGAGEATGAPPGRRPAAGKAKRRRKKKAAGDLRMTTCAYGKRPDAIDFVEAVVHTGKGEVVDAKVWTAAQSVDAVTDEVVDFAQAHGVSEIRTISEVAPPETCACCGERLHTIVTDDDAARSAVRRLH